MAQILSFINLLNLPVREEKTQKKLGNLSDILLLQNTGRVCAIEVTTDTFFRKRIQIALSDILRVGDEEIIVKANRNTPLPERDEMRAFGRDMEEKQLKLPGGRLLGRIKAGSFDLEAGELVELHVSRGLADDLKNGRERLRAGGHLDIGKDEVTISGIKEKSGVT